MGIPDPHRGSQVQRQGASKAADYYAEKFLLFRNSANTLTKRGGLRLILPSWRSCCGGHRHQKLVSATNRAENRTRASVHNATRGASYALVHACAVRSCRADRDSCALCGVPSGRVIALASNIAKLPELLRKFCPLVFNCDGAPLGPAELAQPLYKSGYPWGSFERVLPPKKPWSAASSAAVRERPAAKP